MFKRVFLLVLDGLGVGKSEDNNEENANTLLHILNDNYNLDVLEKLGLTTLVGKNVENTRGIFTKCHPLNHSKDSLSGHYELMGALLKSSSSYNDGFPLELIEKIQKVTKRSVIGNVSADGIEIINELGEMQMKTSSIIIYTSSDSVLQVSAHEEVIKVEELYDICEKIRNIIDEDGYNIARVIARPFIGKSPSFIRTNKRKDFVLDPPINVLDLLNRNNVKTICIGKVGELFNNKSVDVNIKTIDNIDTMMKVVDFAKGDFEGLLFANFNDFDSLYGHRRDKEGYLKALEEFNYYLPILLKKLKKDDLLIITADHGNDPTMRGFNHTREYIPVLIYNTAFKKGIKLSPRNTFADVGATILDNFNIKNDLGIGKSMFDDL